MIPLRTNCSHLYFIVQPISHLCSCSRTVLSVYPPQPIWVTSPEGLGMSSRDGPVAESVDLDGPTMGPISVFGNIFIMA